MPTWIEAASRLSIRIGNPTGLWGEELIVIDADVVTYDHVRGGFHSRATARLTDAGVRELADALAGWPFSEPAALANLVPDSTIVELTLTRDAAARTRVVAYDLARKQPDYAPLLALATRWANALRLPIAHRRPAAELVEIIDVVDPR